MKTVKIFIASSKELEPERRELVISLFEQSERWQQERGVKLLPVYWESLDNAVSENGSQTEYNKKIPECEQFLTICWRKMGALTLQEYHVATELFKRKSAWSLFKGKSRPKIRIYFKELSPEDSADPSLEAFKKEIEGSMHYRTEYKDYHELSKHFINRLEEDYLIRAFKTSVGVGLIGLVLALGLAFYVYPNLRQQELDLSGQVRFFGWLGVLGLAIGSLVFGILNLFEKQTARYIRGKIGFSTTIALIIIIFGAFFIVPPVSIYHVSGKITDASNRPVAGVEVNIEGTEILSFSDSKGIFQFTLNSNSRNHSYMLVTSHSDYQDFTSRSALIGRKFTRISYWSQLNLKLL